MWVGQISYHRFIGREGEKIAEIRTALLKIATIAVVPIAKIAGALCTISPTGLAGLLDEAAEVHSFNAHTRSHAISRTFFICACVMYVSMYLYAHK